jgi:hypothetical protein
MFTMKPSRWWHKPARGSMSSIIILVLTVLVALALLFNRQYIVDQISVWQYQPGADVTQLANNVSMNGNGRFLFYASHPSIDDARNFNQHCSRKEVSTAILGCYNGQHIFIYNVADERLRGIREVTAAHEMLHAAYARLSNAEKSDLHTLLNAEYEKLKNDHEFAERMAFYERTEPGERDNELHSIIGTEVASIGPELGAYYKKYFDDRGKIVILHQDYAKVFNDLQRRGQGIAAQLTAIAQNIEETSAAYNTAVKRLNQDIADFNNRASNEGFTSNEELQAAQAALVARAGALEQQRTVINNNITRYDQLRDELTAVAHESDALNKSIDSSLAPTPQL